MAVHLAVLIAALFPTSAGAWPSPDGDPSFAEVHRVLFAPPPVPADSGWGRRIVFDQSAQRVWLVERNGLVARTYPVSGSAEDNLEPGSYRVQANFRHAVAYDRSGTMEFFVQFTTGRRWPIGFHSVPVDKGGRLVQSRAQLGTPLSAGCVRQWADDARALWQWSRIGTRVVVTP